MREGGRRASWDASSAVGAGAPRWVRRGRASPPGGRLQPLQLPVSRPPGTHHASPRPAHAARRGQPASGPAGGAAVRALPPSARCRPAARHLNPPSPASQRPSPTRTSTSTLRCSWARRDAMAVARVGAGTQCRRAGWAAPSAASAGRMRWAGFGRCGRGRRLRVGVVWRQDSGHAHSAHPYPPQPAAMDGGGDEDYDEQDELEQQLLAQAIAASMQAREWGFSGGGGRGGAARRHAADRGPSGGGDEVRPHGCAGTNL